MQKKKKKTSLILVLVGSIIVGIVILGIVFISQKEKSKPVHEKKPENHFPQKSKKPPLPEESGECPFYDKQNNLITLTGEANFTRGKLLEFTNLSQVPRDFVVKLWKKGYHWCDILQLWNWKIPEVDIPDLNAEQRIGVINKLSVMTNFLEDYSEKYTGRVLNCVVIVRKVAGGGPQINIDSGYSGSHYSWDKPERTKNNIKKIINLAFKLESDINPANYQITILNAIGAKNFGQEKKVGYGNIDGKSAGSSIYLALASALHQKAISRSVAATGRICEKTEKAKKTDGEEVEFLVGTNLPIRGLKAKITGAAEEGVSRFVLSKYQTSPNLLSLISKKKYYDGAGKLHVEKKWDLKDDYQKEVPSETKEKIQVHWTENIKELKELLLEDKLS